MTIRVTCPSCNAKVNAPDAYAGKTAKCPKCGWAMIVASGTHLPPAAQHAKVPLPSSAASDSLLSKAVPTATAPLPAPHDRGPFNFWSSKRIIIGAAVALGLLVVIVSFSAFSSRRSRGTQPDLGESEKMFLNYVDNGDIDMVRSSLTQSLNWQQVATPALSTIISVHRLELYSDKSDDARKEREFWTGLADKMVANGADVNDVLRNDAFDIASLRFLASKAATPAALDEALRRLADDTWEEEVAFLISKGANVNAADSVGNTALHAAAQAGALKVIARLLDAGANINSTNNSR